MSLFTRRHYYALSEALRKSEEDDIPLSARARIINDLADMLAEDSPNFDRRFFLENAHAPQPH